VTALSDARSRDTAAVAEPHRGVSRIVVAGVVIGLGALFFFFVTRSDLWLDEALTVNIAHLPLSHLHEALKHDGAPPLFYVLLHFWMQVFGTGDTAVRSLSGVFMIGAVVVTWFAARRLGAKQLAWLSALVMATSPYTIRYATETRMYSLVMLLVAAGLLAVQRTIERPTIGRAAVFGVLVALGIYTQYWIFYLLVAVGLLFVWMAWRGPNRHAARLLLGALVVGLVTFLPWLPTFLFQAKHTGTPWGTPVLPGLPIAYTLRDFAGGASGLLDLQEGWLLFLVLFPLLLLGTFGIGRDDRHIELDVRAQPVARPLAFVFGAGLVIALTLNYLGGGAFQSRYSAIVFPFYVILVARGLTTLRDSRILALVAAVVVILGFAGGVRNVLTQRTQAGTVAAVLRQYARPGDVVVYCPDQVGPDVARLAPNDLDQFVYPSFDPPQFVDWVDYKRHLAQANLGAFAQEALKRADHHTLWYVSAPGYTTHKGTCEALSDAFAAARTRSVLTSPDPKIFEKPDLQQFPAR
jgi:hypothetical protein